MAKENQKDLEFEQAQDAHKYDKIEQLDINNKVKTSFLNYAMSVIIARALPDARDGLKPVQRRILYGMNELHVYPNVAHKKSARIVGDVMGKYHPHGDSSIYEAMVHMAQDFSYRYPLVDGHGNFGNIDGDGAAAMRYTEARLAKISMLMLNDIEKDTVDFQDNYDATEVEPVILPSRLPNLLINGATGIAVGMATNIPPHNLGEVLDGAIATLKNPDITIEELMQYIPGPDFPTGGYILGKKGLIDAYTTGVGTIYIRSKAHIDSFENGKHEIVITEIPYGLRKTALIERIATIAKDKVVDGITDLRDETSMKGIRIVVELRKDVNPEVMLNNLYKYTQLQSSYGMNMICLVDNQPVAITLKKALEVYLAHQLDIITRRTKFDLKKAEDRLHIIAGLIIAHDNIDEVIHIIRDTTDGTEKDKLMARFSLDDPQAQAILDMQLKRLSGLNTSKLLEEKAGLDADVKRYNEILSNEDVKKALLETELTEIKNKFGDKRRSEISLQSEVNIDNEDLIPREDVMITVTSRGYVKRMPQAEYKAQSRGGVGQTGMKTHSDDEVTMMLPTNSHSYLLFFTNLGRVYSMKAYQIPEATKISKGTPLVNIMEFKDGEYLTTICPVEDLTDTSKYLFFVTKKGTVKRTSVSEFQNIRQSGIIAISLDEGDELFRVYATDGNYEIVLGASNGKAIHFKETDVRSIGRSGAGVRGILLDEGDEIVGIAVITKPEDQVLVVTTKGYGKRTLAEEYRLQGRGGSGVKALNCTEKNGKLAALINVTDQDDLIITTDKGMVIRMHADEISQTGRNTQGVILVKLKNNQEIAHIAVVARQDDEEVEVVEDNQETEKEETTETSNEVVSE